VSQDLLNCGLSKTLVWAYSCRCHRRSQARQEPWIPKF